MREIWKDVAGYEGQYQVSNIGRVKGLDRTTPRKNHISNSFHQKEKVLKQTTKPNGYKIIGLCKDNKVKMHHVHRLVATAFIPNPLNKRTVNHIDGVRSNNHYLNLEWNTYSENHKHSYSKLGRKPSKGMTGIYGKGAIPIYQIDRETKEIVKRWDSAAEAERQTGFHHSHIAKVCLGKHKQCYGYIWQYCQ